MIPHNRFPSSAIPTNGNANVNVVNTARNPNSSINSNLNDWCRAPQGRMENRNLAGSLIYNCWLMDGKDLSLKDKNFSTLPACIAQMVSLVKLDLTGNPDLKELPALSGMPTLKELKIDEAVLNKLGGTNGLKLPPGCVTMINPSTSGGISTASQSSQLPQAPTSTIATPSNRSSALALQASLHGRRSQSNDPGIAGAVNSNTSASSRLPLREPSIASLRNQDHGPSEFLDVNSFRDDQLRQHSGETSRGADGKAIRRLKVEAEKIDRENRKNNFRAARTDVFTKHPELELNNLKKYEAISYAWNVSKRDGLNEATRQLGKKLFGIGRAKNAQPAPQSTLQSEAENSYTGSSHPPEVPPKDIRWSSGTIAAPRRPLSTGAASIMSSTNSVIAPATPVQDAGINSLNAASLSSLPNEILDSIARYTIAGRSPYESAEQLALLQHVDRGFNAVATTVLHSRDLYKIRLGTTYGKIEHLARCCETAEEFTTGLRSILRDTADVGIPLESISEDWILPALQVLAETRHLQSLELDASSLYTPVTNILVQLEKISTKNPQLIYANLDLRGCNVTSDDVRVLANMTCLTTLNIQHNHIRPRDAMVLANSAALTNLTSLYIGSNRIGDYGAWALANSTKLTNLTSLDLGSNNIGPKGAKALARGKALKGLTDLYLRCNDIGVEGAAELAKSETLTNLTRLDLWGTGIRDGGAKALAESSRLINLTDLELKYNDIGPEGAYALANNRELTKLTNLDLDGNKIGVEGAKSLANSEKLSNLTSLKLGSNGIGAEGVQALAKSTGLSNLTSLVLYSNNIGPEGVKALAKNKAFTELTSLCLESNNIGVEGTEELAKNTALTKLTNLNLGYNKIGVKGAKALASSGVLTKLTKLNASKNEIGDEGAKELANSEALANLTDLVLWNNQIGEEGVYAFYRSETLTKLTHLDVADSFFPSLIE